MTEISLIYAHQHRSIEFLRSAEQHRLSRMATTVERVQRFCVACTRARLVHRLRGMWSR